MEKDRARGKQRSVNFLTLFLMALLFLLYSMPVSAAVVVNEDQTIANKFIRHTVTGITTPLPQAPDVSGFLGASFLTVGDLNNDGILEIVCTSGEGQDVDYRTHDGAVAVFTWDGVNLNSWTQGIINNTFAFPNDPILHDMDGDGDLDILVGDNFVTGFVTRFSAGIYWLENLGGTLTNPVNWVKHPIYEGSNLTGLGRGALMRVLVLDVDSDGKEDIITSRVDLGTWQGKALPPPPSPPPASEPQFTFMEVFRKEDPGFIQNDADGIPGKGGTCYGYSRHVIGDGGGFQFNLADIDGDGSLDIYAPQFLITYGGTVWARPDIRGDSLIWFKNPGPSNALNPWPRYTISNNNTSCTPIGRGYIVLDEDIDNDGKKELIFSTNNHQEYYDDAIHRLWPSGVYFFDIPADPTITADWCPIAIETGNPLLDPTDPLAVANDLFACNRGGLPLQEGSPGLIRTGDINKDGYLDLLVPGDSKGAVYYYESNGSSSGSLKFKRASLYVDPGTVTGGCVIVDIDKDGDLDIIQGIYDTSVVQPVDPGYVKLASSSIFVYENTTPPPTAINLSSFAAVPKNGKVIVAWETESEIDNAGFNIYRAETEDGNYIKINTSLIPAKGNSTKGAIYEYSDAGLKNRKTYYYKLEDVDLAGKNTFHGPVSATPRLFNWLKF